MTGFRSFSRPNAVPLYRSRFRYPPVSGHTGRPVCSGSFPGVLLGFSSSFFLLCWLLCLLPLPNSLIPRGLAFSFQAPSLEASSLVASQVTSRPRAVGLHGSVAGQWAGIGCHFSHIEHHPLWCISNLPRRVSALHTPPNKPLHAMPLPPCVSLCLARGEPSLIAELHSSIQQMFM